MTVMVENYLSSLALTLFTTILYFHTQITILVCTYASIAMLFGTADIRG